MPSIDTQAGAFARVYVRRDEEEKVDGEKTRANGSPILATGGTCEFIGKEILGTAVTSPMTREREAIPKTAQNAMTAEQVVTTP
jgi:hypothetical protein